MRIHSGDVVWSTFTVPNKLNPIFMEKKIFQSQDNSDFPSSIFSMIGNAFNMVKEGKEREAKTKYPMEYHLIQKYHPSSIDELSMLVTRKLQVF